MIPLTLLAIFVLLVLICILSSYLRESFRANRKGIPPYISTYRSHRKLIRQALHLKSNASILDLGCGDGEMLRLFVNDLGCTRAVGYDINSFAIRRGRRINKLQRRKNIELIKDDIYNANLK